jgi:hypothetical protein
MAVVRLPDWRYGVYLLFRLAIKSGWRRKGACDGNVDGNTSGYVRIRLQRGRR